jgi:hypothetical protein
MGYRTADISIRHYADPYDRGMLEAFDWANGREIGRSGIPGMPSLIKRVFRSEVYFLDKIFERLTVRLRHAFGISDMVNPYIAVTQMKGAERYFPDTRNMEELYTFIDKGSRPFFVHVHLLGTHGPQFSPRTRHFSTGKRQQKDWMADFYDDAILDFDSLNRDLVHHLRQKGREKNTLFIITSDHGSQWSSKSRLPLIMRFPGEQYRGTCPTNAQYIDLAPTILEYLEIEIPEWMEGESVLSCEMDPLRPVFSADLNQWGPKIDGWRRAIDYGPPFFNLGTANIVVGDRWYSLNVENNSMTISKIEGHTRPYPVEELPSSSKAKEMIVDHLIDCEYDVASLR